MQNDGDKFPDDEFDDDLDFDELGDDLEDDSWDDLDDIEDMEAADVPPAETPKKIKSGGGLSKKNLVYIVGGVLAVGGGLFVWGQFSGGTAQQVPPAVSSDAEIAAMGVDEDMPPVPVPVEADAAPALGGNEDEIDLSLDFEEESPSTLPAEDDGGMLTPMPGAEDMASGENDLLPLDLSGGEDEDLAALAEDNDDEMDAGLISAPEEGQEEDSFSLSEALEQVQAAPDFSLDEAIDDGQSPAPAVPVMDEAAPAEVAADSDSDTAALQEREEALIAEKEALSDELTQAHDTIGSLENTVSSLQAEVQTLSKSLRDMEAKMSAQASASTAAKKAAAPVEPARNAVSDTAAPAPVKAARAVPPAQSPEWVLRSAQPGRAMIADSRTNDLRTIEVGDTAPGLGRIQSIAVEGGLWVVQGSTGRVSQ